MLELIMGVIGMILYPMFGIIYIALDAVQYIFEAFAGIGTVYFKTGTGSNSNYKNYEQITSGNSGDIKDSGIVYYLLQSNIVKNLFISILILAIFLIIIFTAMAFIKNVYQPKPKSWQEIVGSALKGLANFIFIPVCCLLGVWLGNILLNAINGATSGSGATNMSRKLFVCAAYNANRYRSNDAEGDELAKSIAQLVYGTDYSSYITIETGEDQEYYAQIVDELYGIGDNNKSSKNGNAQSIAIWKWSGASYGYNLFEFNYLILIVGGIFMLYVLGSLAFGMVRRLFILLTLFVISPALCAMYPLDDGNAVKSWKSSFVKETISAYSAIAGMNIFFSILPIVDNIAIVGGVFSGLMNSLFHLFIIVSGLFVVKELISTIAGFIVANDAFSAGSGLMKNTTQAIGKRVGKAASITAGAFGAAKGARAVGGRGGAAFFKSFGKGLGDVGKNALKDMSGGAFDIDGMRKSFEDAEKDKKEHYWDKRNEKVSKSEFESNEGLVDSKIATAKAAGRKLTNEEMAEVLDDIKDKDAREMAAQKFLAYQNKATNKKGSVKRSTTVEKILESGSKVAQEEANRQSAYSARTEQLATVEDYKMQNTDFTDFATAANLINSSVSSANFDWNKGTISGLNEIKETELEALKAKAESVDFDASKAETKAYQTALDTNKILQGFKKLATERKQAVSQFKSQTLSLAQSLKTLSDDYSGSEKALLMDVSKRITEIANDTTITDVTIKQTDVDIEIQRLNTEMKNILNTGKK